METAMWYLAAAVGAIIYFIIGFHAARWYSGKIEEAEKIIINNWQEEFGMLHTGFWCVSMFLFWPLLAPYEQFTDFRRWKTPYYRISDQY